MTTNITATTIKAETLNSNIASMDNAILEKYIKRSLAVVGSYIDLGTFLDDAGNYVYPDDMVQAITFIVEYLYIDGGMIGSGTNSFASERIGDYSYTRKQSVAQSRIDLPINILAILDRYRYFGGNLDVTIGGYDRTYIEEDDDTLLV